MRRPDVDRMLSEMSPTQFDEWQAAHILDGIIGDEKTQRVIARGAAAMTGAWGGKMKEEDFIPQVRLKRKRSDGTASDPEEVQHVSPQQGAAIFGAWVAANVP